MLHYHTYGRNGVNGHIVITYIKNKEIKTEEFTNENIDIAKQILSNTSTAINFTYDEFEESIHL